MHHFLQTEQLYSMHLVQYNSTVKPSYGNRKNSVYYSQLLPRDLNSGGGVVGVCFLAYFICYVSYTRFKGLSYKIDFENVGENRQILALIRAAAGFRIFRRVGTSDF